MADKSAPLISPIQRILVHCSKQVQEYGSCVAKKVPNVEHDMCLKEFLALRSCIQSQARRKL